MQEYTGYVYYDLSTLKPHDLLIEDVPIDADFLPKLTDVVITPRNSENGYIIITLDNLYLNLSKDTCLDIAGIPYHFEKGIYYFPRGFFHYAGKLVIKDDNDAVKEVGKWERGTLGIGERIWPLYACFPVVFNKITVHKKPICFWGSMLFPGIDICGLINLTSTITCSNLLQKYIDKKVIELIDPRIHAKWSAIKIQRWIKPIIWRPGGRLADKLKEEFESYVKLHC